MCNVWEEMRALEGAVLWPLPLSVGSNKNPSDKITCFRGRSQKLEGCSV